MVVVLHHPVPAPPPTTKVSATTPRAATTTASSSHTGDSTAIALRPQTAPSSAAQRFDKRRHHAFVKQLQSTLLAARLETPPVGVSRAEIDRRISILERMIEDVGKMSLEAAAQQEATYNARYVSAEKNRLRREESFSKLNQVSDRRHTENHENHRDEEALLLRHRRRTTDHRTQKCQETLEEAAIERFQRGVAASQRREAHLKELEEKREAAVAYHIKEARRSQRYDEEHRVRNEYAHFKTIRFEDRRQAVENRLDIISRERLQRGYEVSEVAHRKLYVGDSVQAKRRAQSDAAAEKKARDVQIHLERAEQLEENRIDSIRRKRYDRWSGRQDVMAELVFSEYLSLADDAVIRERRHANTKAGGGGGLDDSGALAIDNQHESSSSRRGSVVSPPSVPLHPPTAQSSTTGKQNSPSRHGLSPPSPRRNVNQSASLSSARRHDTISNALSK
ncbi:Hypothetical protein, putative [Bodo saltans]|uniref:Uncharacterized protein n=1 Tax=Bodo saltans TaxID=75058 RepID=A0A0S4JV66_BODSA|nr:Hypothetical protein, putative [Bodo saltans]|eukprot:CUG94124.1 Hypothetical protein, putative [Bodo saltans]